MAKGKATSSIPLPELRQKTSLVLNVMDGNSFKVIETHAARSWDAAKKSGNRIVMKKGNENIYVRVYDDNDHSNVIFITREKVKRLRKKIVGEFDDN